MNRDKAKAIWQARKISVQIPVHFLTVTTPRIRYSGEIRGILAVHPGVYALLSEFFNNPRTSLNALEVYGQMRWLAKSYGVRFSFSTK